MPLFEDDNIGSIERDFFKKIEPIETKTETEAEGIGFKDISSLPSLASYVLNNSSQIWDDVSTLWKTLPVSEISTLIQRENVVKQFGVDEDFVNNELWWQQADKELLFHQNGKFVKAISEANNSQELKIIQDNIYENLEAKEKIGDYNMGYQLFLWSTSLAQDPFMVLNPTKGIHTLNSASKNFAIAATRTAALTMPWEVARLQLDPTSDFKELKYTLSGAMLFGGTIGSLMGKYSKKLRHKEIDKVLNDSWDEINELIDMPRNEMYLLGSKQRTRNIDFNEIDEISDQSWRDDILRDIDDSNIAFRVTRNILKRPFGLDMSWLDESYDSVTVLVKGKKISVREGNEILDITTNLSGDNSYLLTKTDETVEASVNTLYQKNQYGKIHTVKKSINDSFLEINDIQKGYGLGGFFGDIDLNMQAKRLGTTINKISPIKVTEDVLVKKKDIETLLYFERGYASKNLDEFINNHKEIILTNDREKIAKIYKVVKEQSKVYGSVYDDVKADLISVGLLNDDYSATLRKTIDDLEVKISKYNDLIKQTKAKKNIKKETKDLILSRYQNELDKVNLVLRAEKENLADYKPTVETKFQSDYVPIIYDTGAIRRNREWVTNEITKIYSGPRKLARKRAEETIKKILKEGDGNFQNTSGVGRKKGSSFLLERSLNLPPHILKVIGVTDPEIVFKTYIRKIGPRIEIAKKYDGDLSLSKQLDRVDEIFNDAILKAKSKKEINSLDLQRMLHKQNIEDMRDSLLGNLIKNSDGNRIDAKIARDLKNSAAMALGGTFGVNSFIDMTNILAAQGFKPIFNTAKNLLTSTKAARIALAENKQLLKSWGILSEMSMSTVGARVIEDDGVFPTGNRISMLMDKGANEIHKYSGLGPITNFLKSISGRISQQSFIETSIEIAKGVTYVNGKPKVRIDHKKRLHILNMYGLSLRDVLDIGLQRAGSGVTYTETKGLGTKLYNVNTDAWKGARGQELADKFSTAVWAETNALVMTPQMAQIPGWQKGVWRGVPILPFTQDMGLKTRLKLEKDAVIITKELQSAYKSGDKIRIQEAQDKFFANKSEITNAARTYAPLISMMFQFLNFGIGATQKILGAYTQGRHQAKLIGLTSAMMMSWTVQNIKNPYFDELSIEEQFLKTAEYIGPASWVFNAENYINTLSPFLPEEINGGNPIGFRSALGVDPQFEVSSQESIARLGGTPLHIPITVSKVLFEDDLSTSNKISLIRSTLPFMNLPYTKPFAKKAQNFYEDNFLVGD